MNQSDILAPPSTWLGGFILGVDNMSVKPHPLVSSLVYNALITIHIRYGNLAIQIRVSTHYLKGSDNL